MTMSRSAARGPQRASLAVVLLLLVSACSPAPTPPGAAPSSGPTAASGSSQPGASSAPAGSSTATAAQLDIPGYDAYDNTNPHGSVSGTDSMVINLVFDFLIEPDEKGNTVYRLAQSITPNADATQWTVKLRTNATWSDGKPFTSADVIYSFEIHASTVLSDTAGDWDNLVGVQQWRAGTADTIAGLTAPDDHTVVFALTQPNAAFPATLENFQHPVVQNNLVGPLKGLTKDAYDKNPVWANPPAAIGPEKLVQYVPDQYLEFEPNPGWYGTPVKWSKVILHLVPTSVQAAQLQAGTLNLAIISIDDLDRMKGLGYQTAVANAPYPYVAEINTITSQMSDVRVRQAFAYGCDTKSFVDTYYKGYGTYSTTYIQAPWVSTDGLNPYLYDPVKAKALLDAAHFDYSKTVKWLTFDATATDQLAYLQQCQSQLGTLGVKIQIISGGDNTGPLTTSGDFSLYSHGGNYSTLDPDLLSPQLTCAGIPGGPTPGKYQKVANRSNWCNAQVDSLFAEARQTTDQAKRADLYHQASLIINDQLPYWVNLPFPTAYAWKGIQGFIPYGDSTALYARLGDWSPGQ